MMMGLQALEEHIYIRFPVSIADIVRSELRQSRQPNDLTITFTTPRRANVVFNGSTFTGFLVDLPTITETLKSLDCNSGQTSTGQYCKVADCTQMLMVIDPRESDVDEYDQILKHLEYRWPDGLTPPMYQAHRNRWSGQFSASGAHPSSQGVKNIEQVEGQVKALLDRDAAADRTDFDYFVDAKLVKTSDLTRSLAKEMLRVDDDDDEGLDADLAAEIEDELMGELDEDIIEEEEDNEMGEEELSETTKDTSIQQHGALWQELQEKQSQLERVTNPAIRALLEETIQQLQEELKQQQQ